MDDEGVEPPLERYRVHVWMEGPDDDLKPRYTDEHWFVDRPGSDVLVLVFDDAKRAFRALYPGLEPVDFSVGVSRLRPSDNYRPDLARLGE